MKKILSVPIILFSLLCFSSLASAADISVSHKPGEGIAIENLGLEIKPHATYVIQDVENRTGNAWRAELDVKEKFWDWGEAFARFLVGNHESVTNRIAAFSNVDYDAHDSHDDISTHTFWYKQYLFEKQLRIAAGKLDPTDWFDLNKYANDHRTQFLADIFNNSPVIDWPVNDSFGAHMTFAPDSFKFVELAFDYFDNDWKDTFQHEVFAGELNLKPAYIFGSDPSQWDGNYRFYGWSNNYRQDHGFGLNCDQMITDVYGVFGRFGWQNKGTLEWLFSGGGQMTGKYWGRDKDVAAFAVGGLIPRAGSTEEHFELYYNCRINAYLFLTPDMQLIQNPSGEKKDDTISVYGLRCRLIF